MVHNQWRAPEQSTVLTAGVYFLVGMSLAVGQLVPGTTHEIAHGVMLPQSLLWILAAALLATDQLLQRMMPIGRQAALHTNTSRGDSVNSYGQQVRVQRRLYVMGWLLFAWGGWVLISTWHVQGRGNLRFAVDSAWQWVALVCAAVVLTVIARSVRATRMLIAIMFALAWMSAASGFYQLWVSLPADRKLFRENPTEVLRQNGSDAVPGTAEFILFADRLQDESPLGPFSLTNSLAGFLVPWIVMLIGLGLRRDLWRSSPWRVLLGLFVFGTLLWCVVLTKSRAAWIAVAVAVVFYITAGSIYSGWWRRVQRAIRRPQTLISLFFLVFFAGGLGFLALEAWDKKILSEAWKSLTFRGDYWRSSLRMSFDHPWFGVGLGNFQANYGIYKPLLAPETIVDPHNFLLEVLATTGWPAAIILLLLLASMANVWWMAFPNEPKVDGEHELKPFRRGAVLPTENESRSHVKATSALYVGACVGMIAVWMGGGVLGPPPDLAPFLVLIPIVTVVMIGDYFLTIETPVKPIQVTGSLHSFGAASIGLLVHQCASSGWMTPGVINSGLVLFAGLAGVACRSRPIAAEDESNSSTRTGRLGLWFPTVATIVSWMMLVCFYATSWQPMQGAKKLEDRAREFGISEDLVSAMEKNDRWSPTGYAWRGELNTAIAEGEFQTQGRLSSTRRDAIIQSCENLIATNRADPAVWFQCGHWCLRVSSNDESMLKQALTYYQGAKERDPGNVDLLLQHALTSWLANDIGSMKKDLDDIAWLEANSVYPDRKLSAATQFWPSHIGPSSRRVTPQIWQRARVSDSLPLGWVRSQPVYEFLLSQR